MDEIKPSTSPADQSGDISFQVMPHGDKPNLSSSSAPVPPAHTSGGKAIYVIIGLIVLAVLGGLAYYFLGYGTKTTDSQVEQSSKLPASFMTQYFAKETCDDENTCGDSADPENDGLTNYQEFISGTNPILADTDGDGLADGDEVNVYGLLPKNQFTDNRAIAQQNGFNDAVSIKNGYDPITPGSKFTDTRLETIKAKIAQYSLHAPTTKTLGLNPDGSTAQATSNTSINPDTTDGTNNNTPNTSGRPDTTK